MKINTFRMIRSCSVGAALALCMLAGFRATAAEEQRGQLSSHDYKFLVDAAKGGMTEVTLGKLAAEKGADPSVKQFGQKMADDHQKANDELMKLASQKGATLPTETTSGEKREVEHLRSLSGADFDKAYMDHMVKDHKKDVKEFERESKDAKDPEVQAFAAKTLPILQEHLREAEAIDATAKTEKRQSKAQ
jgi:putative membrane protein